MTFKYQIRAIRLKALLITSRFIRRLSIRLHVIACKSYHNRFMIDLSRLVVHYNGQILKHQIITRMEINLLFGRVYNHEINLTPSHLWISTGISRDFLTYIYIYYDSYLMLTLIMYLSVVSSNNKQFIYQFNRRYTRYSFIAWNNIVIKSNLYRLKALSIL